MFFSVIIPIYNVEKFIERGFGSLKGQDFTDFEVILVNDGSTDSSARICDRLAAENTSVSVIHQQNEGSGPARNAGIKAAKGEYILFFDIDDILLPGAFSRLHHELANHAVDILLFGYEEVNPILKLRNEYRFPVLDCRNNNDIRRNYPEYLSGMRFNNGFVWNKAYRRKFIIDNGILFEPLRIQQDEVFNLSVYPKARSLRAIPDILYTYFVYDNGNTRSRFIPERLSIYLRVRDAFLSLYKHWSLNDDALLEYVHTRFLDALINHINFNVFHPQSTFQGKSREKEIFRIMKIDKIRQSIETLAGSNAVKDNAWRTRYYQAIAAESPRKYMAIYRIDRAKAIVKNFARQLLRR